MLLIRTIFKVCEPNLSCNAYHKFIAKFTKIIAKSITSLHNPIFRLMYKFKQKTLFDIEMHFVKGERVNF